MAIEKMSMLSIVGKESELDRFTVEYLINSGLQPENAMQILENGWKLSPYNYEGRAKEEKKKCEELLKRLNLKYSKETSKNKLHLDAPMNDVSIDLENIKNEIDELDSKIGKLKNEVEELEKIKEPITHLTNLNFQLEKVYDLRYMRFRFGKIRRIHYHELQKKLNQLEAIVLDIQEDDDFFWIIYLTTERNSGAVDGVFNMLDFKRIWITEVATGTPKEYISKLEENIGGKKKEIDELQQEFNELKENRKEKILKLYENIKLYEKVYDTKRYMARDSKGSFYIVGWIPVDELKEILYKIKKEKYIRYVVKTDHEAMSTPPTKLKNNFLVKPFENLVEMYGLPKYTEVDPTSFVAITAFFMFGLMFGDVGQGIVIAIIGYILAIKKISLGDILIYGGIAATIFGVAYGSVFGREDILRPLIVSPMNNINSMLIFGIVTGGILIFVAMVINIINGLKEKDIGRVLFDKNGIAGIIFYVVILVFVGFMIFKGKQLVPITVLIIILLVPLGVIFFKDAIITKINTKRKYGEKFKSTEEKEGTAEKSFDLLETLLSFASNTISFVRLSAFAINHVGLCMAVYILAGMVSSANTWMVAVIGNVIIIALEGLIVGIQVLRLEYYELFSRFYSGDGHEYKPL
ncbi:MAG: hypothetical protein FWF46_01070 [Oscillospiraceae bacterium]|nr:hypothetical protein [Oscillospiraceae bacterium]